MTKIEWVKGPDNITQGITVNSKTGCKHHTPEGLCLGGLFPCYAWKLARGRLRIHYQGNWNYPPGTDAHVALGDTFYPRWWPERLEQIRRMKKPTGIFLDDMSDWMGDYWPEEWTRQEFQVMKDCPQHRFYTLTKQAQNLPKWDFLENCWVGVTATGYNAFNEALDKLKCVEATMKFISIEPLLEAIHFNPERLSYCGIKWLISGACTGTKKEIIELHKQYPELTPMSWKGVLWTLQPRIKWLREIVEAANKAGIAVFLKDNLRPLLIPEDCSKPNYLMEDIFWASEKAQLRQEMPEILYCSTCRVRRI